MRRAVRIGELLATKADVAKAASALFLVSLNRAYSIMREEKEFPKAPTSKSRLEQWARENGRMKIGNS